MLYDETEDTSTHTQAIESERCYWIAIVDDDEYDNAVDRFLYGKPTKDDIVLAADVLRCYRGLIESNRVTRENVIKALSDAHGRSLKSRGVLVDP